MVAETLVGSYVAQGVSHVVILVTVMVVLVVDISVISKSAIPTLGATAVVTLTIRSLGMIRSLSILIADTGGPYQ